MKIAIISTVQDNSWRGSEELWAAMAKQALNRGLGVMVSAHVGSPMHPKLANLKNRGALLCERGHSGESTFIRKVNNLIETKLHSPFSKVFRFNPDVICISQGGTYDSVHMSDLLRLLYSESVPYVIVCHTNSEHICLEPPVRDTASEFFSRASRVVFLSERTILTTERQLAGTLPNAMVLRNPVNLIDWSVVPWPESSQLHMACVGNLRVEMKGQDLLFETLNNPAWRKIEWKLRVYGNGPDLDYLRSLADHFGISRHVEFKGYVEDVRSIWAENHLLIMPSRVESAPLALVEAMICGRPSLATDVGGMGGWIQEPETGFLAEAATAKAISAALDRALLAQASWREMGVKANKRALGRSDPSPGKKLLSIVLESIQLS